MLSAGEWSVQGNEAGHQGRRVADRGRYVARPRRQADRYCLGQRSPGPRGQIESRSRRDRAPQENKRNGASRLAPGPGGRGRAEQDPVVRRMQEKFGAEIRTVIDYREKR